MKVRSKGWRKQYNARQRERRKLRGSKLWIRLGLSPEDYDKMLLSQDGGCAICGKTDGEQRFHLDHSHDTDEVRGLLCLNCNTKLGWFEKHEFAVLAYLHKRGVVIL